MLVENLRPREVEQFVSKVKEPSVTKMAAHLVAYNLEDWPKDIRDKCWTWEGARTNKGRNGQPVRIIRRDRNMTPYPTTGTMKERCIKSFRGKNQNASRVAYRIFIRELEVNETVSNVCNNIECVNPAHHYVVKRKPRTVNEPFKPDIDFDFIPELMDEIERIYGLYNPADWDELWPYFENDCSKEEVVAALNQLGGKLRVKFLGS